MSWISGPCVPTTDVQQFVLIDACAARHGDEDVVVLTARVPDELFPVTFVVTVEQARHLLLSLRVALRRRAR